MARSVSQHRHAIQTAYLQLPEDCDPDFGWQDFVEDLANNVLREHYPSLQSCDRWQDREDHVLLENARAEISVSEYNGIVAVCLAPLNPDNPLDVGWCERAKFTSTVQKAFPDSTLLSQGRCSNGEQIFTKPAQPGSCVTSKEGQLW